jgi:hypothetical protein
MSGAKNVSGSAGRTSAHWKRSPKIHETGSLRSTQASTSGARHRERRAHPMPAIVGVPRVRQAVALRPRTRDAVTRNGLLPACHVHVGQAGRVSSGRPRKSVARSVRALYQVDPLTPTPSISVKIVSRVRAWSAIPVGPLRQPSQPDSQATNCASCLGPLPKVPRSPVLHCAA